MAALLAVILLVIQGPASARAPVSTQVGLTLQSPDGWRATVADAKRIVMVGPDGDTTLIATLDQATDAMIRAQLTNPVDLGGASS